MMTRVNDIMLKGAWVFWLVFAMCVVSLGISGLRSYTSPLRVTGIVSVENAAPGKRANIRFRIDREVAVKLGCHFTTVRTLKDSSPNEPLPLRKLRFSAELVGKRAIRIPGESVVEYDVPFHAAYGPAVLSSKVAATCTWWHRLFGPYEEVFEFDVEVLKP